MGCDPGVSGTAGNSSAGFAMRSYSPVSVVMVARSLSSTDKVRRVSGSSFVISNNVFKGRAVAPACSRLTGISTWIVISRSVARRVVFSSDDANKTQPKIGRVERVGVALESFCNACCSSVLDVENFIEILS